MKKKKIEHLVNAPIIEAVLDIKVTLPPEIEAEALNVHQKIASRYPYMRVGHKIELAGLITPKGAEEQTVKDDLIGYRYESDLKNKLVQFRLDGFTFNQLKPYPKWEEVLDETWQYWLMYVEHAKPIEIDRIAVRYINKTPFPGFEPLKFLESMPNFNKEVPGSSTNTFFLQSQLSITKDINATVIQILEPETTGVGLSYTLDIDVYRMGTILPSDANLREYFNQLRDYKNDIFFNVVTEEALKLWR